MIRDVDHDHAVEELLNRYFFDVDLVIAEGYKASSLPKIEVHRPALAAPLLCVRDADIIALVSDDVVPAIPAHVVVLPLNQPEEVAEFVVSWLQKSG